MKLRVAVIFGGTNTEHEVSIASARSIINNLDPAKFEVTPIYITKNNVWTTLPIDQAVKIPTTVNKTINPSDLSHRFDIVFPVLHGPYGEDGTLQGMLEMLHLPYVGCGVLASALCMDKVVQKQLCLQQGIPVVPFAFTTRADWQTNPDKVLQYINNKLHYPLFVKPANQGSSIGITKVHQPEELIPAINHAFIYDSKVIFEQGIEKAREIECALLGNYHPQTSVLGEIIPSNEFYDYDAKYVDGKSEDRIPARLPTKITTTIQKIAFQSFKLLNCSGLARIDFLVSSKTLDVYLNEINTMPGFTQISMYPKLWQASGLSYPQLLEELIQFGLERFKTQSRHQLSITPKLAWHKQ